MRSHQDRFAPAGLSCNGNKSGRSLPGHFFDQGEVADAQRGERCGHGQTMP